MGFQDRLSGMNDQWDDTSSGFGEMAEGIYTFQVVEAVLKETQKGDLRVAIQYCVAEGQLSGETAYDGFMIEKDGQFFEVGARMFKGWLERMGYEVPPIDEVEDTLALVTQDAPLVLGEVKKNGDFTNIRIRERLDMLPESTDKRSSAKATPAKPSKTAQKEEEESDYAVGDVVEFNDDEGNVIRGKIITVDGDTLTVLSADDEEWEDIPADELRPVGDERDEKEEETEEEEEAEEDTADLLEFIATHDLEGATDDMERVALVGVIDEYEWNAKELTKDEVAFLEDLGIKVKKPRASSKKKK